MWEQRRWIQWNQVKIVEIFSCFPLSEELDGSVYSACVQRKYLVRKKAYFCLPRYGDGASGLSESLLFSYEIRRIEYQSKKEISRRKICMKKNKSEYLSGVNRTTNTLH